jgi:hypothetical protein
MKIVEDLKQKIANPPLKAKNLPLELEGDEWSHGYADQGLVK